MNIKKERNRLTGFFGKKGKVMRWIGSLIAVLCIFAILAQPVFAGSSRRIGKTTFHNFSDGTSGTSRKIGKTTFHNFSDGTSGTSRRIGNDN